MGEMKSDKRVSVANVRVWVLVRFPFSFARGLFSRNSSRSDFLPLARVLVALAGAALVPYLFRALMSHLCLRASLAVRPASRPPMFFFVHLSITVTSHTLTRSHFCK